LFLANNPLKVFPIQSEKLEDATGASLRESADTTPPSAYLIARLLFSFPSWNPFNNKLLNPAPILL